MTFGQFFRGTIRALTQMVFGRWPRSRAFFGSLPDERNYAGIVGDGRGSALLMSCVSWVVNAFTQMRPMVVQIADEDELSAEQVVGHEMTRLFRRPTFDPVLGRSYYTWMTMIAGVLVSFIVDGNGYLLKVRGAGGSGRPVQLWYRPHSMMEPIGDPDQPTTFIAYYDYCPDGTNHYPIRVEDVIHLRDGLDPDNPRKGLSKVKTLLREIYTDEEAARWTSSLLRNHALPGLILAPKMPLDNVDDAKSVKARLNAEFGGDRRGSGLVLEGPTDVTSYGFSPEQMKLGDIRDIPEERISAAVGIPAAVVGFGAGLQSTKVGATMAELVDLAWQNGVMPRAHMIALEITEQLLSEFEDSAGEGMEFVFDTTRVPIMADYRNKEADTLEKLMRWSVIQRGEGRRRLGLPVGPRDRVYVMSSGLTEVDATKSMEEAPAIKPVAETAPVTAVPGEGAPAAALPAPATPALSSGKDLTSRETTIGVLIGRGMTTKAIASQLDISPRTVEREISSLMEKADVNSRAELVGWLVEQRTEEVVPDPAPAVDLGPALKEITEVKTRLEELASKTTADPIILRLIESIHQRGQQRDAVLAGGILELAKAAKPLPPLVPAVVRTKMTVVRDDNGRVLSSETVATPEEDAAK
jgi:HK97 family phage portal protein